VFDPPFEQHTASGWCDAEGADPETCSWSAKVVKVVNKTCAATALILRAARRGDRRPARPAWHCVFCVCCRCSDEAIYSTVEAYDAAHGSGLFAKCAAPHDGRANRNTSDPCWIYSFYATVLGPAAVSRAPRGSNERVAPQTQTVSMGARRGAFCTHACWLGGTHACWLGGLVHAASAGRSG
jgi:hypothetical protein